MGDGGWGREHGQVGGGTQRTPASTDSVDGSFITEMVLYGSPALSRMSVRTASAPGRPSLITSTLLTEKDASSLEICQCAQGTSG